MAHPEQGTRLTVSICHDTKEAKPTYTHIDISAPSHKLRLKKNSFCLHVYLVRLCIYSLMLTCVCVCVRHFGDDVGVMKFLICHSCPNILQGNQWAWVSDHCLLFVLAHLAATLVLLVGFIVPLCPSCSLLICCMYCNLHPSFWEMMWIARSRLITFTQNICYTI